MPPGPEVAVEPTQVEFAKGPIQIPPVLSVKLLPIPTEGGVDEALNPAKFIAVLLLPSDAAPVAKLPSCIVSADTKVDVATRASAKALTFIKLFIGLLRGLGRPLIADEIDSVAPRANAHAPRQITHGTSAGRKIIEKRGSVLLFSENSGKVEVQSY